MRVLNYGILKHIFTHMIMNHSNKSNNQNSTHSTNGQVLFIDNIPMKPVEQTI